MSGWLRVATAGMLVLVPAAGRAAPPIELPTIEVVESAPSSTTEVVESAPSSTPNIERDKVPANVQTLSAPDFDHARSSDLLQAIGQRIPGVILSDQTGNPFQL